MAGRGIPWPDPHTLDADGFQRSSPQRKPIKDDDAADDDDDRDPAGHDDDEEDDESTAAEGNADDDDVVQQRKAARRKRKALQSKRARKKTRDLTAHLSIENERLRREAESLRTRLDGTHAAEALLAPHRMGQQQQGFRSQTPPARAPRLPSSSAPASSFGVPNVRPELLVRIAAMATRPGRHSQGDTRPKAVAPPPAAAGAATAGQHKPRAHQAEAELRRKLLRVQEETLYLIQDCSTVISSLPVSVQLEVSRLASAAADAAQAVEAPASSVPREAISLPNTVRRPWEVSLGDDLRLTPAASRGELPRRRSVSLPMGAARGRDSSERSRRGTSNAAKSTVWVPEVNVKTPRSPSVLSGGLSSDFQSSGSSVSSSDHVAMAAGSRQPTGGSASRRVRRPMPNR